MDPYTTSKFRPTRNAKLYSNHLDYDFCASLRTMLKLSYLISSIRYAPLCMIEAQVLNFRIPNLPFPSRVGERGWGLGGAIALLTLAFVLAGCQSNNTPQPPVPTAIPSATPTQASSPTATVPGTPLPSLAPLVTATGIALAPTDAPVA